MTNCMRVVECSDYKVTYGILVIEDVSVNEVQEKVNALKTQIASEIEDWTIEDVFSQFPDNWKWKFVHGDMAIII